MNLCARWAGAVIFSLLVGGAATASGGRAPATRPSAQRVPVIYSTDLLHPHDDPDDHFDLATLLAIPAIDLRAVILDLGERQKARPGRVPLQQMFALAGRSAPFATGLSIKLKSPTDDGRDQPAEDQHGVELLLETLRVAREPVTLITAGSLRDVNAALVRDPQLVRRKVSRMYLNIGNADGKDEWNITLDTQAYVGVMRSGLPIYLCPCQPFNDTRSTYWNFSHAPVLEAAPAGLQNFFIYALQVVPPELIDPQSALRMDLRPWRHLVWSMKRQMWCTPSFLDAAGYVARRDAQGKYMPVPEGDDAATTQRVFSFVPARVNIDDNGHTQLVPGDAQPNMHVFACRDPTEYGRAMTDCLTWLLGHFEAAARR